MSRENCYDVNSMYPEFPREMPCTIGRPHACCNDNIHFTVFYYGGEWRVFFWTP